MTMSHGDFYLHFASFVVWPMICKAFPFQFLLKPIDWLIDYWCLTSNWNMFCYCALCNIDWITVWHSFVWILSCFFSIDWFVFQLSVDVHQLVSTVCWVDKSVKTGWSGLNGTDLYGLSKLSVNVILCYIGVQCSGAVNYSTGSPVLEVFNNIIEDGCHSRT